MPTSRSLVLLALAVLAGCSGGGGGEAPTKADGVAAPEPAQETKLADIPVVHWTPDPKAGDPSVPPELGGPGFTGEGWTTADTHQIGDPKAPQGGTFVLGLDDWPPTTRFLGQNSNHYFTTFTKSVMYDTLLDLDPVTMEFVPHLATHWQISEDRSTYRFRLDPSARWSDGKPITAEDVVATWKLNLDPTHLDPSSVMVFSKFEEPKALSPYLLEVKVKEQSWRNFLYFSANLFVLPAHEIAGLTGKEFVDKYQFAYTAVSGPYEVRPEDIETGQSLTLTRRKDWWGESNPAWDGLFNFEEIKFVVALDPQLRFEKIKKGEMDYFIVPKAQWWAEDIPALDEVKRGMLVPRKFYTEAAIGTSGMALNPKVPPLDDVRVRKALQHLYDRKTLIKKLFYDEYEPLTSYFQSATYTNPANQYIPYDEVTAVELLEQAGWTEKDGEGYRVKDGKRLAFKVTYATPLNERDLTVFQEACKKAGIQLELQLLTPATSWKNLQARQYEIQVINWSGLEFPNPETSWKSSLADETENNNVTSFKNARVDELLAAYDVEYDVNRRAEIIREIDGILYNEHPYVLGWYGPAQRVLYWNRFGMPEWGVGRFGRNTSMFVTWWVDPEKEEQLAKARSDSKATMERPAVDNRFWQAWAKAHGAAGTGG